MFDQYYGAGLSGVGKLIGMNFSAIGDLPSLYGDNFSGLSSMDLNLPDIDWNDLPDLSGLNLSRLEKALGQPGSCGLSCLVPIFPPPPPPPPQDIYALGVDAPTAPKQLKTDKIETTVYRNIKSAGYAWEHEPHILEQQKLTNSTTSGTVGSTAGQTWFSDLPMIALDLTHIGEPESPDVKTRLITTNPSPHPTPTASPPINNGNNGCAPNCVKTAQDEPPSKFSWRDAAIRSAIGAVTGAVNAYWNAHERHLSVGQTIEHTVVGAGSGAVSGIFENPVASGLVNGGLNYVGDTYADHQQFSTEGLLAHAGEGALINGAGRGLGYLTGGPRWEVLR